MTTSKKAGSTKTKTNGVASVAAPLNGGPSAFTSSDLLMLDSMAELVSDWARRCADRLRWADALRRDQDTGVSRREVLVEVQREAARNLFSLYDATRPRPEERLSALEQELRLIIHAIQERGDRPLADAAFSAISVHAPLIAHRCDVEMNDDLRCRLYVLLVNDASAVGVWFGEDRPSQGDSRRPHFSAVLAEASRILDLPAPARSSTHGAARNGTSANGTSTNGTSTRSTANNGTSANGSSARGTSARATGRSTSTASANGARSRSAPSQAVGLKTSKGTKTAKAKVATPTRKARTAS